MGLEPAAGASTGAELPVLGLWCAVLELVETVEVEAEVGNPGLVGCSRVPLA